MERRTFNLGFAGALATVPLASFAHAQAKVWRIGFLYFGSRQSASDTGRYNAFLQGMRELGYIDRKNVVIETRFGDGKIERLPGLVAELVRLKVDVIVATGSAVYRVLQRATTIPIVVTVTADPMIDNLAASLSRPGGNFTGLTDTAADLGPKQIELVTAIVPKLSRLGVLLNPDNMSHPTQMKRLMLAAQNAGVQIVLAEAGTAADIEPGFDLLTRERANAVILFGDTFFVQQLQLIAEAAFKHRMASIYTIHEYAQAGGLMSYGADLVDNFRRAAAYVDKILKGGKPGELAFEQPTRYFLAINLKTAKALGLTIPPSLLQRADEVIR
jgi:putative tryptophan/tyrosine transport system substrate-binding protein